MQCQEHDIVVKCVLNVLFLVKVTFNQYIDDRKIIELVVQGCYEQRVQKHIMALLQYDVDD